MSQGVETTTVQCVLPRLEAIAVEMNIEVAEIEVWIGILVDEGVDQGRHMEGAVGTGAVVLEDGRWMKMPIYPFQEEIQGMCQMFR